jgi:hypothetical protein
MNSADDDDESEPFKINPLPRVAKALGQGLLLNFKDTKHSEMAYFAPEPPPTPGEMFITSTDTLNGSEMDLRVTPGWNDRPPLLVEKGTWLKKEKPEDPALLKGVSPEELLMEGRRV